MRKGRNLHCKYDFNWLAGWGRNRSQNFPYALTFLLILGIQEHPPCSKTAQRHQNHLQTLRCSPDHRQNRELHHVQCRLATHQQSCSPGLQSGFQSGFVRMESIKGARTTRTRRRENSCTDFQLTAIGILQHVLPLVQWQDIVVHWKLPQNFKKHFSRSDGFHYTKIHTGSYWKDRVNTPSDWQLGISLIG